MSLNDLSAAPLQDAVDVNNLPEQFGGGQPFLQPGNALFALSPLTAENFDKVDSPDYGERVKVKFDQNAPLVILQSVNGRYDNQPFTTSLSNVPRRRGKDADAPIASDWDYLNQALKEAWAPGEPRTNRNYATRLMTKAAARAQFRAKISASWNCRKDKNIYMPDGQGGYQEMDQLGCGTRKYEKDVTKVNGEYPERIECQCGASVRGFNNLETFRAVE